MYEKLNKYEKMNAIIDCTYYLDPNLIVASQGNVQSLANGNQFIGWGQEPYLSEFENEGNSKNNLSSSLLFEMKYPNENISYRAFKNKWIGWPQYPPSIVAITYHEGTFVYASWNGSTETVAWQVLSGHSFKQMQIVKSSIPRKGFETKIVGDSVGPYFQVRALNEAGQVLGISRIVRKQDIDALLLFLTV